jgi:tetratricopeptide (TPR) repeat protein
VLFDQKKIPEAIGHWEQALQIKPTFAAAHYNLANAFLHTGRLEEAIEHYKQALQIEPDYAAAHVNLGITLEQVNRVKEAIEHYEQAVLLKPDLVDVQKRLSKLRAEPLEQKGAR